MSTILIIENDSDFSTALQLVFSMLECDSVTFGSAEEGIMYLKSCETLPTLVWTDYDLGTKTGEWVIATIQENPKLNHIPIILCSSEMHHGISCATQLQKPVDINTIKHALKSLGVCSLTI